MVALCLHILLATNPNMETTTRTSLKEPPKLFSLRNAAHSWTHGRDNHNNNNNPQKQHVSPRTLSRRQEYEQKYPPTDKARIRDFVQSLRNGTLDEQHTALSQSSLLPYDIMDCPDVPPPEYPVHFPLLQVLEEWPVDVLQWPTNQNHPQPHFLHHSLCIFDWTRPEHRTRIMAYQAKYDVPFLVRNHDEILQATERWMRHDPAYLASLIEEPQRTEHSTSNHLPFWRLPKGKQKHAKHNGNNEYKDWKPPTENIQMTFREWYDKAVAMDEAIANGQDHTNLDHYYFRLNGDPFQRNTYLYEELPMFDPDLSLPGENVFMWEPDEARGINCRLGMAGNIAEAHYDAGRNWILLVGGGQRRYILGHPRQCPNLALYPVGHPSARHSAPNWSDIGKNGDNGSDGLSEAAQALAHAEVTQVVLQASDALFLPTHWFHFIVSLNRNYQCNARSGSTSTYAKYITDCGFPV